MANTENHAQVPSLSEQEQIRRAKLQALFDCFTHGIIPP